MPYMVNSHIVFLSLFTSALSRTTYYGSKEVSNKSNRYFPPQTNAKYDNGQVRLRRRRVEDLTVKYKSQCTYDVMIKESQHIF